jgi:hypothetical protein
MFRGLDESNVPSVEDSISVDDPLRSVFQQRIEAERLKKEQSASSSVWKPSRVDRAEEERMKEQARAKRDSWVYEDAKKAGPMSPEDSGNYATSGSNDKYMKYYDPDARDMEYNGAYKKPPHPRQRHRCDYHLEDVLQSVTDRKYPVWDTFKVWVACMRSPVGEEPERLRKEVWRW